MILRLSVGLAVYGTMLAQVPPGPESAVIRATSRLVNVNVLAVDKKGNPVRDLKREDFVLLDNGTARPISLFALEAAEGGASAAPAAAPTGTFTNRVEEKASSVTIFLFDGLNTRTEDQVFARTDLLNYLKKLEPNDRVALFALGRELMMVHDFTTDAKVLADAIGRQGTRQNQEVETSEPMASNSSDPVLRRMLNNTNQIMADYAVELRARDTAAALEAIAAHAARVPGRKNLVWVSGGFPVAIGFGNRNATNRQMMTEDVDRAVRALNDADIAVYPVDARRLETQSVSDLSSAVARPLSSRGQTQAVAEASKDDPNFTPMEELAEGTGGRAFHNVNDLGNAIRMATTDARVSYALAFTPAEGGLDGKYHAIKLEVKRPGVQLRYRTGYVAYPDAAPVSLAHALASPADFTGVGITVNLKPVAAGMTATFSIDAKDLTMEKTANGYQVHFEMLVLAGAMRGTPKVTPVTLNIAAASRDRVMKEGLTMATTVKAVTGPVTYHIGIRDVASGAIGTLHLSKN